jgi:hypothetical protein
MFKKFTMAMTCIDFAGKSTNCWDVIDVIQIHAYAKSAKEVKQKIASYYAEFSDDFEGTNGRTKKSLWLSEVAMGSSNGTAISEFVTDLLNPTDGLTNRGEGSAGGFGYVSRVSCKLCATNASLDAGCGICAAYPMLHFSFWGAALSFSQIA